MGRLFGSRALLAICATLIVLLAALAAIQYRWSTRVAAADVQREKEHLDAASALFATEFNTLAGQALSFLQTTAWPALQSGERLTGVPKLLAEIYYLDIPPHGAPKFQRLTPEGTFAPAPQPEWMPAPRCAAMILEEPPVLVAPIYVVQDVRSSLPAGIRILKTARMRQDRCFAARIDRNWLRSTLFPQLIRSSFGETSASEYDFAVTSPNGPREPIYGSPRRADLRKRFFSIVPVKMERPPAPDAPVRANAFFVQRIEGIVANGPAAAADLFGPGVWELEVAHKGVPLAAAFEQTRRRDLLFSAGIEALLVAAIVLLIAGARRAERFADRKMRFVAGVSHELRTPVSAISMLSRNQADGLVAGPDKVRQYGELIHQQSRRLNEMVEQALEYAGIHSGLRRAAHDEIDLPHLLEEAVAARREELSRAGFEIETAIAPGLPPVPGDEKLLRMAFDNLLSNALKHAKSGRWIRVAAAYSAPEKQVRIGVEDRGAGIDPADQAGIFEPFSRGRAAVEGQIPGSGLGLSLVRSAAEVHRGSVTLESKPGRGSTFTIHLPV